MSICQSGKCFYVSQQLEKEEIPGYNMIQRWKAVPYQTDG